MELGNSDIGLEAELGDALKKSYETFCSRRSAFLSEMLACTNQSVVTSSEAKISSMLSGPFFRVRSLSPKVLEALLHTKERTRKAVDQRTMFPSSASYPERFA